MRLYEKILAVMQDVQYLQKDDNVSTGGTGSYKAISEEKVTETVRASLIKHKLVIFPIEQEHKRDDTLLKSEKTYNGKTEVKDVVSRLSTVNTKYKIVDVETGEFEMLVSSGTGVDTQDKGVGKAMTYAYKYLLLRTFAIPTGEDPDKISSDELTDKQQGNGKATTTQANTSQITQPKAPVNGPSDAEFAAEVDKKTGKDLKNIDSYKDEMGNILCSFCELPMPEDEALYCLDKHKCKPLCRKNGCQDKYKKDPKYKV